MKLPIHTTIFLEALLAFIVGFAGVVFLLAGLPAILRAIFAP